MADPRAGPAHHILQGLGGLAVLAGAVVAALNLRETSRQNRAIQKQSREVIELQPRGQTTERFSRAIEQLNRQGPENLDIRIGAVYALEQIARDSADLHWQVMEVLTAHLREHRRVPSGDEATSDTAERRLPADHQVIATVIGRRRRKQDPEGEYLDLRATDLRGVRWSGAHLEGAWLWDARLESAVLCGTHMERAALNRAHLSMAMLEGAPLEGAVACHRSPKRSHRRSGETQPLRRASRS